MSLDEGRAYVGGGAVRYHNVTRAAARRRRAGRVHGGTTVTVDGGGLDGGAPGGGACRFGAAAATPRAPLLSPTQAALRAPAHEARSVAPRGRPLAGDASARGGIGARRPERGAATGASTRGGRSSRSTTSATATAPPRSPPPSPSRSTAAKTTLDEATVPFTLYSPPTVSSIAPADGPAAGGFVVTVRGEGFGASALVLPPTRAAALARPDGSPPHRQRLVPRVRVATTARGGGAGARMRADDGAAAGAAAEAGAPGGGGYGAARRRGGGADVALRPRAQWLALRRAAGAGAALVGIVEPAPTAAACEAACLAQPSCRFFAHRVGGGAPVRAVLVVRASDGGRRRRRSSWARVEPPLPAPLPFALSLNGQQFGLNHRDRTFELGYLAYMYEVANTSRDLPLGGSRRAAARAMWSRRSTVAGLRARAAARRGPRARATARCGGSARRRGPALLRGGGRSRRRSCSMTIPSSAPRPRRAAAAAMDVAVSVALNRTTLTARRRAPLRRGRPSTARTGAAPPSRARRTLRTTASRCRASRPPAGRGGRHARARERCWLRRRRARAPRRRAARAATGRRRRRRAATCRPTPFLRLECVCRIGGAPAGGRAAVGRRRRRRRSVWARAQRATRRRGLTWWTEACSAARFPTAASPSGRSFRPPAAGALAPPYSRNVSEGRAPRRAAARRAAAGARRRDSRSNARRARAVVSSVFPARGDHRGGVALVVRGAHFHHDVPPPPSAASTSPAPRRAPAGRVDDAATFLNATAIACPRRRAPLRLVVLGLRRFERPRLRRRAGNAFEFEFVAPSVASHHFPLAGPVVGGAEVRVLGRGAAQRHDACAALGAHASDGRLVPLERSEVEGRRGDDGRGRQRERRGRHARPRVHGAVGAPRGASGVAGAILTTRVPLRCSATSCAGRRGRPRRAR